MENFELIDDYLQGRLAGQDKQAFEQQLQADPSLQSEVAIQKTVIEGIKKARMAELKAMLNQVPVTGAMTQAGISASQIAVGAFTAGAIITGTLFYFKPWEKSVPIIETKIEKPVLKKVVPKEEPKISTPENKPEEKSEVKETKKKEAKVKVASAKKIIPKLQVTDPTEELRSTTVDSKDKTQATINHGGVSQSRIEVEMNDNNKEYTFHYQFDQGKLILYGTFDKALYEIIEVNGDSHSIFLYYKESYYLLDEKQTIITPLLPVKDAQLIRKLKDYRN